MRDGKKYRKSETLFETLEKSCDSLNVYTSHVVKWAYFINLQDADGPVEVTVLSKEIGQRTGVPGITASFDEYEIIRSIIQRKPEVISLPLTTENCFWNSRRELTFIEKQG